VEAELVREGEAQAAAAGMEVRGIAIPDMIASRNGIQRRDLSVTGGTTTQYGGELVATEKRGLLDDFYKASVMIQGGAMVLNGLVGNVDLPRYNAAADPAKKTENETAGELSPTFTSLSLSPKRLPAVMDISDQLLRQSSVSLETFLRRALARQLSAVQEVAFWHGTGTSEPTGVAATTGIGSVAGGTNGAAPDWADIVDLETAVAIDDALVGTVHYVTNAKVRGKLKQTVKVGSTDSRMIWEGNDINGYMPMVTNAVSSTLTKGTSSGVCSAIFFGNLEDFVVGYWGGLDLEIVTDKTLRTAGQRALVANLYYDGGVLRAESFAAMLDALTA
jgi:HK97 family phage major capsid protein